MSIRQYARYVCLLAVRSVCPANAALPPQRALHTGILAYRRIGNVVGTSCITSLQEAGQCWLVSILDQQLPIEAVTYRRVSVLAIQCGRDHPENICYTGGIDTSVPIASTSVLERGRAVLSTYRVRPVRQYASRAPSEAGQCCGYRYVSTPVCQYVSLESTTEMQVVMRSLRRYINTSRYVGTRVRRTYHVPLPAVQHKCCLVWIIIVPL
jgi:hypothetical protein